MIQFDVVGKSFRVPPGPGRKAGVVEAVRGISLQIETGRIIGVVGPNGAGKTTLFGLLLGFIEPTSGNIAIDGLEPRAYVQRHGANYLPERFQLPRDWTIMSAFRALLALDRSPQSASQLLDQYQLRQFANAPAHTLSRGTMQRAGIAQALATPRRLVVLDEPTEGLDPVWRVRLRELVRELRAPDRTIMIASHDLSEIELLCERAIVLHDGAIAETVELRSSSAAPTEYTIALASEHEAMKTLFDGARLIGNAAYTVTVSNAADLNARLAALIDSGATIVSVNPAVTLEDRIVRPRMESH